MKTGDVSNNSALVDFLQGILSGFKVYPRGYAVARCPFHSDKNPSLFINPITGQFNCKACKEVGGLVKLVAGAKGLKLDEARALLERLGLLEKPKPEKEEEYFYFREDGSLAYKVVRFRLPDGRKTFKYEYYDYNEERWVSGKGEAEDVLYNLGEVLEAEEVIVVEGEKDVESLRALGFVATTNPSGAGNWKSEYAKWLEGRVIYLIPDNDNPGISYMRDVAESLKGKAQIKWVDLSPLVPPKGDISDLITSLQEKGKSEEEVRGFIRSLLEQAEPYTSEKFSLLSKLSLKAEDLEGHSVDFLIDGFIPQNSLILITAKFGGGKSLSALAIAKRLIAEGHRVVYVDLDNSLSVIKERLQQAELINYLGKELVYLTRSVHAIHSKAEVWRSLKKELKNTDESYLVVIDTLKNFSKGMELNSDKEMTEVMSELMDVREAGHTVVILHHLPKRTDEGAPYKNNTTIVDAVDVAYQLKKDKNKLVFENFKDRIQVKPVVSFEIDEKFNLTKAVPPKVDEEKTIARVILKLIPPEGRKQGDLIAAVSEHLKAHHEDVPHGKNRIREVLDKYVGRLWEVVTTDKNAKIYKRLIAPSEIDLLFSCLPSLYMGEENRQTQEPQGLECDSGERTAGKLNGDNGSEDFSLFEEAYKEVFNNENEKQRNN